MNTYLDEKGEQQDGYRDKLKLLLTGKSTKIRVTKKKRLAEDKPAKEEKEDEPDKEEKEEKPDKEEKEEKSDKEDETSTIKVKGRLNESLAEIFDELSAFMVKRGEPFKSRAYQKAQESILMYPADITHENYKELVALPGIGNTIIQKIGEYIKTGTLRLLDKERADPQNIFADVYGIGPKKASELVGKGLKTIDELKSQQDKLLNAVQKVGLKYYDDILQRIPRSEIDEFHGVFSKTFEGVKDADSKYEIVGSYRRNAMTSGDIDVIITSTDQDVFKRFVDSLLKQDIILEILSRGATKSLVVAKLSDKPHARRVDFLYTSPEEYPFAVLYFTGSKIFNTVMRGRALSLGYSLNEHGLHQMDGKKKGSKVDQLFSTEEDIFKFLQMKYKEPFDRKTGQSVVPMEGSPKMPTVLIPENKENVTITIQEKSANKTRKNRITNEERAHNKEIARIEKERVAEIARERRDLDKQSARENKTVLKEKMVEEKEDAKKREKMQREDAKKKEKKEKEDAKKEEKKEREEAKKKERMEKEQLKQQKRDAASTKKRREKESSATTIKKRDVKIVKEKKINKSNDTIKMRRTPKNKTNKMSSDEPKHQSPPESMHNMPPVDFKTSNPVMHAIQNYKNGGISVLEQLNEETLNGMLMKTNEVYRNLGPNELPLITDNQYDILEDFIKDKYPKNTVVGKIGAPVEKNKVNLPYEMASMDKIKPDTKALASWKSKYSGRYVVSCKLDGVSGMYTTENKTFKLYTRGDGKVGQDISHFIPHLNLPKDADIVVRGEFIMSKSVFSKKYADKFANGRNLVAGTINRHSINNTVKDMDFVAYEVIKPTIIPSEQMAFLEKAGFKTVRNETRDNITNDVLSDLLVDWRANYDYEIDGVIVTDDKIYPRTSGNPDHSFAFKMVLSDQMAETKVLDVEWKASKDGYLKPRVRIEPVHLSGVKIEYATGFNAAFIESNRIGVGALIQIIRSGDVIPYIKKIITPADKGLLPTIPYIWNDTHVDIMLENKDDDKTVREKNITGFFKGIGVDGLGEGNVIRIIEAGFDTIPKILRMSEEDYLTIEGFQTKMAKKLHTGIREKIDAASLITLMSSSNTLGRGFSGKKIELVMEEYPNILTSPEDNETKIQKLSEVKGMASKTAQSFVENIPTFIDFLDKCGLASKIQTQATPDVKRTADAEHPLYKKSIVMSGTRDKELESELKRIGANMGSSVSSNTFALITPDVDSVTGKVASAKKHNVKIYTPEAFRKEYLV